MRSAMLRGLDPDSLAAALESFERGDLRAAATLWQAMAQRDDVLSSVKAKREKALARRDWQVVAMNKGPRAARHVAILKDFWNNIKAVDAFDQNDSGSFSKLVRQMLTAVSYKYSAHHIVWRVEAGRLVATFEHVPLQFFENRTGRLRFCATGMEVSGTDLAPGEWMINSGDGLMVAGSIGYLVKRNSLADWLAFSEKFGVPGVLGRTNQGADTPGGLAMAEAVESFSNDWNATIFGDDGSAKIELITAGGGASLPFPGLIERVDRRLAALYRGADLGSISSTSGQGTGASLQEDEATLIELDDAISVSEKLNEVERLVLEWHEGAGVVPEAYIKIQVPEAEDSKLMLEATQALVRLGARISVSDAIERFGFTEAKPDDAILREPDKYTSSYTKEAAGAAPQATTTPPAVPQLNAALSEDEQFLQSSQALLAEASLADRQQVVEALKGALTAPDQSLSAALRSFLINLPKQMQGDAQQVQAWEKILATALLRGWSTPDTANP